MSNGSEYTKTEYNKIIDNYNVLNAWKDENSFPIKNASDLNIKLLEKLHATEFVFSGTQGDSSVFEDLFVRFNHFLEYFISLINRPIYIFKSEFKSRLPNRIRTYKGILPKEIEVSTYYQEECNLLNKNSIIAGVVKLNEDNISISNELFYDSDTSFIIISRRSILSSDFVNDVVQNKMIHKNNSFLNYTKVLSDYCSKGDIIIRMGGDGGDRYIALQIFFDPNGADMPTLPSY